MENKIVKKNDTMTEEEVTELTSFIKNMSISKITRSLMSCRKYIGFRYSGNSFDTESKMIDKPDTYVNLSYWVFEFKKVNNLMLLVLKRKLAEKTMLELIDELTVTKIQEIYNLVSLN